MRKRTGAIFPVGGRGTTEGVVDVRLEKGRGAKREKRRRKQTKSDRDLIRITMD